VHSLEQGLHALNLRSTEEVDRFTMVTLQQQEMKATLLSDIERGFEALKTKLDFAPRVNSLDTELS
jgi:hypothetical protein